MRTVRAMVIMAMVSVTPVWMPTLASAQTTAAPAPQQQDTDQGVGVGALGGLTITSARGEDTENIASGTGWMFGIWFGGNINGPVGFMAELSYVRKKITADFDPDNNYLTINYLEIPALVRFNIGSRMREGLRGYGLVGPVFDVRLSSKFFEDGEEITDDEFEEVFGLENVFSSVDIGIMAGAGIEWNRIGFEFRYSWGLMQLTTDEAADSGLFPTVKANTIQILGKFRFN